MTGAAERVVVTGWSCITALGFGPDEHEAALRSGRAGSGPITRFDTSGFKTRVGGQCDERRLGELLERRWPAPRLRGLEIDTRMFLGSLAWAIEDAGLEVSRPLHLSVGSTLEGFCAGERWYDERLRRKARPRRLLQCMAGAQAAVAAELLEIPLAPTFMSSACASGAAAIGRLFRSIRAGRCDAGVAGGYDYLSRFTHLGFDALGNLTEKPCAPFDRDRCGFFVGDGAAMLVLESLTSARRRGARIRGEILGYGESVDGYHLTHPDPEARGMARAIRLCLEQSGVRPEEIDYVNAHGTATAANDAAEARGLLKALGEECGRRVAVSSTKALTGHTLGAAGAVEECFCLLALERGFLPPQANLGEADPACPLRFVRSPEGRPRIAMNNSFGFGGANGILLARRWEEAG